MERIRKSSSLLGSPTIKKFLSLFENQSIFGLAMELHDNPGLTTKEVADLLRVSRSTAFRYLSELVSVDVVEFKWEVSSSSAPKAIKSFSLTKEGLFLIELLIKAIENSSD